MEKQDNSQENDFTDEQQALWDSAEGFIPADDEHINREKKKARELRQTQWWKNELAKCRCHYCGRKFRPQELTMDHIVPIIRGGFTKRGNVVPCCKECNNQKKYLLPQEWQEYMARLQGNKETTVPPKEQK